MLTSTQIAARKIGGSSAGTILGLNKYRTRHQEYLRMIGEEEPEDLSGNIHIHTGNLLEPVIAEILHDKGYLFDTGLEQDVHPRHEYITRTLDGIDGTDIHEIKTADTWMKKQFENGPIPMYNAQINHYALWPGTRKMYLHVLFIPTEMKQMFFDVEFTDEQLYNICTGLELKTFECEPDFMLQDYMLEQYAEFMRHVELKIPPPAQNMKELTQMFMLSSPGAIPATDADLRADTRMREIKGEIKDLEQEYTDNKFKICEKLGSAERLISGDKTIRTWKTNKNGSRVFR